MLMAQDMGRIFESYGESWEGWEDMLEAEGLAKEDLIVQASGYFVGELEELSREVHRQLTIQGNEAWELQLTGKLEGELARAALIIIFGEDDMGLVMMLVKEARWGKFEGTWTKIRDSAELAPKA